MGQKHSYSLNRAKVTRQSTQMIQDEVASTASTVPTLPSEPVPLGLRASVDSSDYVRREVERQEQQTGRPPSHQQSPVHEIQAVVEVSVVVEEAPQADGEVPKSQQNAAAAPEGGQADKAELVENVVQSRCATIVEAQQHNGAAADDEQQPPAAVVTTPAVLAQNVLEECASPAAHCESAHDGPPLMQQVQVAGDIGGGSELLEYVCENRQDVVLEVQAVDVLLINEVPDDRQAAGVPEDRQPDRHVPEDDDHAQTVDVPEGRQAVHLPENDYAVVLDDHHLGEDVVVELAIVDEDVPPLPKCQEEQQDDAVVEPSFEDQVPEEGNKANTDDKQQQHDVVRNDAAPTTKDDDVQLQQVAVGVPKLEAGITVANVAQHDVVVVVAQAGAAQAAADDGGQQNVAAERVEHDDAGDEQCRQLKNNAHDAGAADQQQEQQLRTVLMLDDDVNDGQMPSADHPKSDVNEEAAVNNRKPSNV